MFFATLAPLLVLLMTTTQSPTQDARIVGWRSDIDHLVAEAKRQHAGPARPAHSAEFSSAAARLKQRVPTLPDRLVVVELQRLLAMLRDGHSLVYPAPTARAPFAMLPIDLYVFSDGVYVVDAMPQHRALIGSRVARIGGKSAEELLRALPPYVSRDNDMGVRAFASIYLVSSAFLESLGATADSAVVHVTLEDSVGRQREVALASGPARRTHRSLIPPPGSGRVATYLEDRTRPARLRVNRSDATVVMQFNAVADQAGLTLAQLAQRLADSIEVTRTSRVIVDLRHNTGGNNQLLAPLLDVLTRFAADTANHRLCVLTSRSTFSAAQNFINRLEQRAPHAVFAGEASMSSPNFTGEDNPVTLPWSGLTVSISNRYWQDAKPNDRRPWINPQIPVAVSGRDWLANRDVVMNAVDQHPRCRALRR